MTFPWLVPPAQALQVPAGPPAPFWQPEIPKAARLQLGHVGIIQRWGLEYLRIDYYADPRAMNRRPQGATALDTLLKGHVWCGERITILQGIGAARRRQTLLDQFQRHWPGHFDPRRPSVLRFLAAVDVPLDSGDTLTYLFDPSGVLHFRAGQQPWRSFADPELAMAFRHLTWVGDSDNREAIQALSADLETAFPHPPSK